MLSLFSDLKCISLTLEEKENLLTGNAMPPQLIQSPTTPLSQKPHNVTPQSKSSATKQDGPHTLTPPHTPTYAHSVTKYTTPNSPIIVPASNSEEDVKNSNDNENKGINTNSILGKRQSSERGCGNTEKSRGSTNYDSESVIFYYPKESQNQDTSISDFGSSEKGRSSKNCDNQNVIYYSPKESGDAEIEKSDSGTGMEIASTGMENRQIGMRRGKSHEIQAHFDDMLSTIPFEEIAGFPLVQPSPDVPSHMNTSSVTTPPSDVTTPSSVSPCEATPPLADTSMTTPPTTSGQSTTTTDNIITYTASKPVSPIVKDKDLKDISSPDCNMTSLDSNMLGLSEVKGYLQEEVDLQRAVNESLQTQPKIQVVFISVCGWVCTILIRNNWYLLSEIFCYSYD